VRPRSVLFDRARTLLDEGMQGRKTGAACKDHATIRDISSKWQSRCRGETLQQKRDRERKREGVHLVITLAFKPRRSALWCGEPFSLRWREP